MRAEDERTGARVANVDETWEAVFAGLERLRQRWPMPDWSYDRRLKTVASSFPTSVEAAARAAMVDALTEVWSGTSIGGAPAGVQALNDTCGGLRAAQLLFWGGEPEGPGAFGLWWPWGDGKTVSLRVGLHGVDIPKQRYPRLRDVFGIPQAPAPA
jgi:hypothetical protein